LNGNELNLARLAFEKPGGKMIEVADANFSPKGGYSVVRTLFMIHVSLVIDASLVIDNRFLAN